MRIARFYILVCPLYAGFCSPRWARGDDHLSRVAVARNFKRRSNWFDGTIKISNYPNPPCITISLPTYAYCKRTQIPGSRDVSLSLDFRKAKDVTSYVSVALVLLYSLGIQQSDGCYPHSVPAMPGRSSHLRSSLRSELRRAGPVFGACRPKSFCEAKSEGRRSSKEQMPIICFFRILFKYSKTESVLAI